MQPAAHIDGVALHTPKALYEAAAHGPSLRRS